jgi:hypothetical protein
MAFGLNIGVANAAPQEVVVVAPKPASLSATYPADGAEVPGGTLMMKLVFDQNMAPGGWSYTPSDKGLFPRCLARPRLLADQKTFVLLCSLAVNTTYALEVNATAQFESEGGRRPAPHVLIFKTTDAPTLGLHDALAAAGLSDADDPIMGEMPGGPAVQSSANFNDGK